MGDEKGEAVEGEVRGVLVKPNVESLYRLVTLAIRDAEALEDAADPGAKAAQLKVSRIEEKIAELLPAGDKKVEVERAVACRGAVSAAFAGGDAARAVKLAATFMNGAERELQDELNRLIEEHQSPQR